MVIRLNKKFLGDNVIILVLLSCSALSGMLDQTLLSIIVAMFCMILLLKDELYLAYPFILFYNQLYGTIFGISVQRLFSLLIIVLAIARLLQGQRVKLNRDIILPIFVYVLYALLVISSYNLKSAIFSILDVVSCALLIMLYFIDNNENLRRFFTVYIYVSLIAFWTGLFMKNIMSYGNMDRFLATFEDPNYMGFFYTVAIFAIVCLKLFRPWIRIIIIAVLYMIIGMSLSMTAIVVNILLWAIYLSLTKKMNIKILFICICVIFLLNRLYMYGLNHPDTPVLGALSGRIEEKVLEWTLGNFSDFTTGRSDMAQEHFKYFLNLPFINILCGGIAINTSYIQNNFRSVAHNEYVDLLLNVGILGTVILLTYFLKKTIFYYRKYKTTNNDKYICLLMFKITWMIYVTALTVFMEDRFMLPFFI